MLRSILKKPLASDRALSVPAPHSREDRNRETALYHANLLQQRKDVEALVLSSTETLLDFPSSPHSNPANPSVKDASIVKTLLRPFQPSDYDALIEERNINRKCGYVICPRSNKIDDTKAPFRILRSAGKGADAFKVVESRMLEKWCSDDCAKRALYIKVQLSEKPAWTRAGTIESDVTLLEDVSTSKQDREAESRLVGGLEKLNIGLGEDKLIAAMKELAVERGDGNAVSKASRVLEVDIHENTNATARAPVPTLGVTGDRSVEGLHNAIEGYTPKLSYGKILRTDESEKEDDAEDMIRTI